MATIGFDISGLDPQFKAHAGRGIGRYVQELHNYFSANANSKNLKNSSNISFFDYKSFVLPNFVDYALNNLPLGKQTVRQQLCYPLQLSMGKMKDFNLLHFPAQTDAPSWCPKKFIITVHDIIPLVCADSFGGQQNSWRFKLARMLELQSFKKASHIIASSQSTANDLKRVLQIPEEKITVVHLGVDEKFFNSPEQTVIEETRNKFSIAHNDKVLLYVGGIDPNKNVLGLLKIFKEVTEHYQQAGGALPKLIIAGKIQKQKNYPELLNKISEYGLESNVILPGFIADSELLALYRICSVFVFASLYEGFGFPICEAMAAGIPVVAVNTSSIPEIAGEACLLFNADDPEKGVRDIIQILENPELKQMLQNKGPLQAAKFPWSKTAQETVAVYEKITKQPF